MTTTTITSAHPWAAAFGPGPYRYLGCEEKWHRDGWHASDHPRPGSTCDACSTAIAYVFRFRSASGVEFKVGSDCAEKSWRDYGEVREIDRMQRDARAAAKAEAAGRAKIRTAAKVADLADLLQPVGDEWRDRVIADVAKRFAATGKLSGKQVDMLRRFRAEA